MSTRQFRLLLVSLAASALILAGIAFYTHTEIFESKVNADVLTGTCSSTDPASPTEIDASSYGASDDITLQAGGAGGPYYCYLSDGAGSAAAVTVASLTVDSDVVLTHPDEDTTGVNVTAATVTINGDINVDGRGCSGGAEDEVGEGPNPTSCATSGSGTATTGTGGGGAGHGGSGGQSGSSAAGGSTYGSVTNPVLLGAAGAASTTTGADAVSDGGGYVNLTVSGTLTIDGAITADGLTPDTGQSQEAGGGAGGSINITADTIGGTGSLTATGGDGGWGGHGSFDGGAGGGGRIAVYYTTENDGFVSALDTATAVAGGPSASGATSAAGNPGSLFISQDAGASGDDITIACNGLWADFTEIDFTEAAFGSVNDLTFVDAGGDGYCQTSGSLDANGEVTISSGVILVHENEDKGGIDITATDITVTGDIYARGRGCAAGVAGAAGSGPDTAGDNSCIVGGTGAGAYGIGGAGAGHGGAGGNSGTGASGGSTYDSTSNPVLLGAGGAGSAGTLGGRGGGLVILDASGTLTIDGTIDADGTDGWSGSWGGGGGAGGSINLTAGTIGGSGSVVADGGTGNNGSGSWDGGGGGGGIIVFSYASGGIGSLTTSVAAGGVVGSGSVGSVGVITDLTDVEFQSATSSLAEKDSGTTDFDITIETSKAVSGDTDVDYAITGGTATLDDLVMPNPDYVFVDGTATILDGTSSITITVTVNGDNLVEDDETIIIELSNPTNGVALGSTTTHTVTITNDDVAAFTLNDNTLIGLDESSVATTDEYTLVLDAEPTEDVVVTLGYDSGELTVTDDTDTPFGGDKVTFTAANWNVAQTVRAAAVDNDVDETSLGTYNSTITHTVASVDGDFDGLVVSDVTATIADNDAADATVDTGDGLTVSEDGTTDSFTVVLATEPVEDVVVSLAEAAGELDISSLDANFLAGDITFDDTSWDTPVTIDIAAVDDAIDEGGHTGTITFAVASVDGQYDGLVLADLEVTITDNDTSEIIDPDALEVTLVEGTSEEFDIELGTEPTADVTVAVSLNASLAPFGLTVEPASLTFTDADYSVGQTITVTHVDDDVDVTGFLNSFAVDLSATSGDGNYDGQLAQTTVGFTDDDTAGVTITETDAASAATEGATDTITFVLDSEPLADLTITVTTDDQLTVDAGTLTFTSENWDTEQTLTITAVDDTDVEGEHTSTMSFAVTAGLFDAKYGAVTIDDITFTITDNDAAAAPASRGGGSGGSGGSRSGITSTSGGADSGSAAPRTTTNPQGGTDASGSDQGDGGDEQGAPGLDKEKVVVVVKQVSTKDGDLKIGLEQADSDLEIVAIKKVTEKDLDNKVKDKLVKEAKEKLEGSIESKKEPKIVAGVEIDSQKSDSGDGSGKKDGKRELRGEAEVKFKFPKKDFSPEKTYEVWFVNEESGEVEYIGEARYDEDEEFLRAKVVHFSTYVVLESDFKSLYTDLQPGSATETAVRYLERTGTLAVDRAQKFNPDKLISRAELLAWVLAAFEHEVPETSLKTYKDVTGGSWFFDNFAYAGAQGILTGYPDGSIRPYQDTNFAELAKVIAVAADLVAPVERSGKFWFDQYVGALASRGVNYYQDYDNYGVYVTRGWAARVIYDLHRRI